MTSSGRCGSVEHEALRDVVDDVGRERHQVAIILGGRAVPGRHHGFAHEDAVVEDLVALDAAHASVPAIGTRSSVNVVIPSPLMQRRASLSMHTWHSASLVAQCTRFILRRQPPGLSIYCDSA